ncbi:MAG: restriction endonuclease, SacI family [Promethearchaeota archaeon]
MSEESKLTFKEKCKQYLFERWDYILHMFDHEEIKEPLSNAEVELKKIIKECLTSRTKSYRYVLPTQLLSKSVDHSLNCTSLQVGHESPGSFDARTIAHYVIVPFDNDNHDVLGGSKEPYVNNPLRCPAVSVIYRDRQRNKGDWDKLIFVLNKVQNQNNESYTRKVFDQILFEIHKLLDSVRVIYPIPSRISLKQTVILLEEFLSERSGGSRLEAIATALFRTISDKFNLFDEVRREKINVADVSSGMVADIECYLNKRIALLVEVKDRSLSLIQLNAKIDSARSKQIKEILFMAQNGIEDSNRSEIETKIAQEFTSGQNIYVTDLSHFAEGILIILGENGRVDFLKKIGLELDSSKSPIKDKKTWAALLRKI